MVKNCFQETQERPCSQISSVWIMGNLCGKQVCDVDHSQNKLEHLKMTEAATLYYNIRREDKLEPLNIPERQLSDNGPQYEPRKEGSPFH